MHSQGNLLEHHSPVNGLKASRSWSPSTDTVHLIIFSSNTSGTFELFQPVFGPCEALGHETRNAVADLELIMCQLLRYPSWDSMSIHIPRRWHEALYLSLVALNLILHCLSTRIGQSRFVAWKIEIRSTQVETLCVEQHLNPMTLPRSHWVPIPISCVDPSCTPWRRCHSTCEAAFSLLHVSCGLCGGSRNRLHDLGRLQSQSLKTVQRQTFPLKTQAWYETRLNIPASSSLRSVSSVVSRSARSWLSGVLRSHPGLEVLLEVATVRITF